ncbi:hypothetical protein BK126_26095 [Paenibacillus sp. FSL H7-0326]|nr:hypothetical protein BK126_26095 [Paenibacillus sp. FSL H7-0326]
MVCVFTPFAFRMVTGSERLTFQGAEPPAAPLTPLEAKSLSDMFKGLKTFFSSEKAADEKTFKLRPLIISL